MRKFLYYIVRYISRWNIEKKKNNNNSIIITTEHNIIWNERNVGDGKIEEEETKI